MRLTMPTFLAVLAVAATAWAAPTPAQRCEADVELATASFTKCRLRAESIFSKSPDAARRSTAQVRCSDKLSQALAKADLKYGMVNCTAASAADYDAYLSQCTDEAAAAAVAGGTLPRCGNGVVDVVGEQCDGGDLSGESCASLGFLGGAVICGVDCRFDTSGCDLPTCGQGSTFNQSTGTCDAEARLSLSPIAPDGYELAADKPLGGKTLAPLPTARFYHAAATMNGRVYVIGGQLSITFSTRIGTVEEYDPASGSSSSKSPMLTAREGVAATAIGDKIYAIGGWGTDGLRLGAVEEYDAASDQWVARSPMPTARGDLSVIGFNGLLYAVSGYGPGLVATVEVYDPSADSWSPRSPIPTARTHFGLAEYGGKLYAMGGTTGGPPIAVVEEYNPVTDSWSSRSPMPIAAQVFAVTIGDKVYAVGDGVVQEYDPVADIWRVMPPMPSVRYWFDGVAIDGRIYAFAGVGSGNVPVATVEVYDPAIAGNYVFVRR